MCSPFHIKAIPQNKLHITWHFIGDTASGVDDLTAIFVAIRDELSRSFESFSLAYATLEMWPQPATARVAVLTPLAEVEKAIEVAALFRKNLPGKQAENFKPHLTIFRCRQPSLECAQAITAIASDAKDLLPVKQTIELKNIHLIDSDGYQIVC